MQTHGHVQVVTDRKHASDTIQEESNVRVRFLIRGTGILFCCTSLLDLRVHHG